MNEEKKIAGLYIRVSTEDKNIDLTQPEYNPTLVKRLYKFKGEM